MRPDAPPILIAHGDQDTYVPVDGARRLAEQLHSSSANPVVYAELPGAQHSFDLFHSIRFELLVDAIAAFLAWVRSQERACPTNDSASGGRAHEPAPWTISAIAIVIVALIAIQAFGRR